MAVIEVSGLRKSYGSIVAVDGMSFEVRAGEVYALLGHNGAGKSTTVEILEGHRDRTAGGVTVLGTDPQRGGRELRDRIGIVLQTSGLEHELCVDEALELYSSCYRHRRPVAEVLELVGLAQQ
ncbi:MAG: ATP-binding cassette domain-containing protein, partial [Candidatus Limnocylindrales bacterium]